MTECMIHSLESAADNSRPPLDARRRDVGSLLKLAAAVGLAMLIALAASPIVHAQSPGRPTLYARLGGYDAIAGFVDTAFPRVAAHPELGHLFRGHSQDSQLRQRQLIVDALCQATGGPCLYTGRPMKTVHVGLAITAAQWDTFMQIIAGTADERKLPEPEKTEFLKLFSQRFRSDVVER